MKKTKCFGLSGFRAEVRNKESLVTRLYSVSSWWWSVALGRKLQCGGLCSHCMKVWSVVVQRELNSLPECLLVCDLVVMEWRAVITGDHEGWFRYFSSYKVLLMWPLVSISLSSTRSQKMKHFFSKFNFISGRGQASLHIFAVLSPIWNIFFHLFSSPQPGKVPLTHPILGLQNPCKFRVPFR